MAPCDVTSNIRQARVCHPGHPPTPKPVVNPTAVGGCMGARRAACRPPGVRRRCCCDCKVTREPRKVDRAAPVVAVADVDVTNAEEAERDVAARDVLPLDVAVPEGH